MRKILGLVAVVSVVLGITSVPGAGASPPLDVVIEDSVVIDGAGVFTASGPAVDAGAMCPSGTTALTSVIRQDLSADLALLRVEKVATCGDGSGTFGIAMRVLLTLSTGDTTAKWRITPGTGDHVSLRGHGDLVGIPIVLGESILDIYSGVVKG